MSSEEDFAKFEAVLLCNSLEDIFSNSKLDPVKDYSIIIKNLFEDEIKAQFIISMINQGNLQLVAENIGVLDINQNLKIAKDNPQFMKIFFEHFNIALENTIDVYDYTLADLAQSSVTIDNNNSEKNLTGRDLITTNWRQLAEKTTGLAKIELLQVLNHSNDGKKVIKDNLPELIYGEHSYSFLIDNILKNGLATKKQITELVVNEPTRMLSESFEVEEDMFEASDFIQLLSQIDELLETTPDLDQSQVEKTRADIEEYLSQNFDTLLNRIKLYEKKMEREGYPISSLKELKNWDTDKHLLRGKFAKNYEEIANNIKKEDIMDFIHLFADTGIAIDNINIETIMKQTFPHIQDEDLQWAISRLSTELLQDQKLEFKDMQIFGKGHYSRSIKIGEYILKVGEDRSTNEIPYDERIIQPLNRRKLEGKNNEAVFIEVQNLVDKDWYKGLTDEEIDEELYKIYSEMRSRGHRWTDVRKDNVGRLLKPNSPSFEINGNTIMPEDSAVGFTSEKNTTEGRKVLPAGELVIIDTDFIFEADKSYSGSIASKHKEFEERYIRETAERASKASTKGTVSGLEPVLLTSAIATSETQISDTDIKQMSDSILSHQKNFENQIDSTNKTKDENVYGE